MGEKRRIQLNHMYDDINQINNILYLLLQINGIYNPDDEIYDWVKDDLDHCEILLKNKIEEKKQ